MTARHIPLFLLAIALSGCAGGLPQMLPSSGANAGAGGVEIADLSSENGAPPLPERRSPPASAVASAQGKANSAKSPGAFFAGSLASLFTANPAAAASPSAATPRLPSAPEQIYVGTDPITVYSRLAAHIKACWLSRIHPALAEHKFTAAADPGGTAAITLYRKVEGAKLGIASFRIKIAKDSGGSTVTSENVKLPEAVKAAMLFDIANWAKGGEGCATRSITASASATGQPVAR